ncbi:uncharacterized protein LOC135847934 [Planococcus citri]|uniref:uncharacterized protein LOC135847934 n=1 Tax=Planococcus citri TaxID=170843 RepID=UPI0031F90CDE
MRLLIHVLFLFLFLIHGQCSDENPTSDVSTTHNEGSKTVEGKAEELAESASDIQSESGAVNQPPPPPLPQSPLSTRRPNDRRKARDRRHKAAVKLRKKKGRRARHHAPKGPRLRRIQRIRRRYKAMAKRRGKKH